MSAPHHSRDSASTTSRLIFGLLAGNLLAVLCVAAFRSSASPIGIGNENDLVMAVGVMSLVAAGLLFLASAMPRRSRPWWTVTIALNVMQFARLIPAVVVVAAGSDAGTWAGLVWTLVFVPLLGVLSAVGLVMTLREVRRSRRRRLARA